ncbi:MAG: hypothetical protein JWM74_4411, partial [Myxococcaceae bacterium]|nr:hypothetical protein [Myxococcaceae bacterium]
MWRVSAAPRFLVLVTLTVACHAPPHAPPQPTGTAVAVAASSSPPAAPAPPAPPALPNVATDWCTAGMLGLDEETCYVVPAHVAPSTEHALVIYLPGIVPPVSPNPQLENVDRIVHDVALARGFTAMIPRGRRGIGPPHAKDYYAWPTSTAD